MPKTTPTRDDDVYKTKMCRTYAVLGSCPYGDKCLFAHGTSDVRGDHFKVTMCRDYSLRAWCPRGMLCSFAHGGADLRRRKRRLPMMCPLLAEHGTCSDAESCIFCHGVDEFARLGVNRRLAPRGRLPVFAFLSGHIYLELN